MKYKNEKGELFNNPSKEVIKKYKLEKISEEEFKKILEEKNKPSEQEIKTMRIAELQGLLGATDYKDLPNYKPKKDEDLSKIIAERDGWREEIRKLKNEINA